MVGRKRAAALIGVRFKVGKSETVESKRRPCNTDLDISEFTLGLANFPFTTFSVLPFPIKFLLFPFYFCFKIVWESLEEL